MDNLSLEKKALHLYQVEKLSIRQIAKRLGVCRKRIRKMLKTSPPIKSEKRGKILEPYGQLMATWYGDYPRLKAKQIYERLMPYGYGGSYRSVVEFTKRFRRRTPEVYHTLSFLPAEEAQIDWFFFRHESLGMLAGFLYVLSYSRYAWGKFYPRTSFEFFLAAHLECFEHLKGLAHRHRYDNLKSVVLGRQHSNIEYNPQFLDFARFFGFSIHACNPYSGNEKGRVERLVRDARVFLYGRESSNLKDMNVQFQDWLRQRSQQVHRSTGKTPLELLGKEKLMRLPQGLYPPTRTIPAVSISKTALVEFETNRYSVPSSCASQKAQIIVWPEKIEIYVSSQKVATHPRSFETKRLIQNPLHTEKLLERTSDFKYQRILQLMQSTAPEFSDFLEAYKEEETEKIQAAYELFKLLKIFSPTILISAIRELIGTGTFKIKALYSLLNLPAAKETSPVWPADAKLLNLSYTPRSLKTYDPID